jgi:hypothetical protein
MSQPKCESDPNRAPSPETAGLVSDAFELFRIHTFTYARMESQAQKREAFSRERSGKDCPDSRDLAKIDQRRI